MSAAALCIGVRDRTNFATERERAQQPHRHRTLPTLVRYARSCQNSRRYRIYAGSAKTKPYETRRLRLHVSGHWWERRISA